MSENESNPASLQEAMEMNQFPTDSSQETIMAGTPSPSSTLLHLSNLMTSIPPHFSDFDAVTGNLTTFTVFRRLPIEIRYMIWESTMEPRVVTVYKKYRQKYFTSGSKNPVILSISKESRKVVLMKYQDLGRERTDKDLCPIYINPSIDTAYFFPLGDGDPLSYISKKVVSDILYLAILGDEQFPDFDPTEFFSTSESKGSDDSFGSLFLNFESVRELTLVKRNTRSGYQFDHHFTKRLIPITEEDEFEDEDMKSDDVHNAFKAYLTENFTRLARSPDRAIPLFRFYTEDIASMRMKRLKNLKSEPRLYPGKNEVFAKAWKLENQRRMQQA